MTRAIALLWLLAGCSAPLAPPPENACRLLPVQGYSAAENAQLASEIAQAPAAALWPRVVADYVKLRDAVRACVN